MAPTFWILTPEKGVTSIPLTFAGRAIYARMCCQCVSGLRHLPFSFPSFFPFFLSPYFSPFSVLLSPSLYKWSAVVTHRWRNPQLWVPKEKSCCLSLSLSPFSFPSSFPFPFPFLLSPFPLSAFSFRFLIPFPFPLLLSLSPFLFSVLLSPAIGWHCPRWLRHLFSSEKILSPKNFWTHTPLTFSTFWWPKCPVPEEVI